MLKKQCSCALKSNMCRYPVFLKRQAHSYTSFGKERDCLSVHEDAPFLLMSLIKCYWKYFWIVVIDMLDIAANWMTAILNWWHAECSLKTGFVLGYCLDKFNRRFIPAFWHVPAQSGKWWKRFKCHIQPCSFKAAIQFYAERYNDLCSWKW